MHMSMRSLDRLYSYTVTMSSSVKSEELCEIKLHRAYKNTVKAVLNGPFIKRNFVLKQKYFQVPWLS
jgi:hypothetical protein